MTLEMDKLHTPGKSNPQLVYDYRDEDYGIGLAGGDTLSLLAGGIELLNVPVFTQKELQRMMEWARSNARMGYSTDEDRTLYNRIVSLIE